MHTELKFKYDLSEQPPLPPAPHFDWAAIAGAKQVQPLRWPRILRYSRGVRQPPGLMRQRSVLRLGTAVLAGFMMAVLGMGTMARLNKQINVASTTQETSEPADATADALPAVETEPTTLVSGDDPSSVSTDRRRHRGHRHIRVLREMFEQPMFVW